MKGFVITFSEGYFPRILDRIVDCKNIEIQRKGRNFAVFSSDEEGYKCIKNIVEKKIISRYIGNLYPFSNITKELEIKLDNKFIYKIITNDRDLLENLLKENPNIFDKKKYDLILSIFHDKFSGLYYFGVFDKSYEYIKVIDNFKPICRSYYKIEEAFEVFKIPRNLDVVLDIGSAPGGWVQFLSKVSKRVIAVDPADLKFRSENVIHIRKKIEEAFEDIKKFAPFDLITCDINTGPLEVFDIIEKYFDFLKKDGSIIFTIKLIYKSRRKNMELIEEVKKKFEKRFKIVDVKWLLSNRKLERTLFARYLV